jgi:hypothetical protein
LNLGLFRKGEYIQIEALVEATHEIQNDENIFDLICFNHRISQTQKIAKINLLSETQIKKKKSKIKERIWSTLIQMLVPIAFSIVFFLFFKSAEIIYRTTENGKINEYKATPKRDGFVELKNIKTSQENLISILEFQDKTKYIPFIPNKTIWQKLKESWIIIPFCIAFMIIFGLTDYLEVRKSNKIYQILNKKE